MQEKSINITIHNTTYHVVPFFSKYVGNERTALVFVEDGAPAFDATVNIEDAPIPVPNNDYIIVKDYDFNKGLADELIRHGFIKPKPIGHAHSGYITAPIHKLTDKAIAMRDEHFKEQGIEYGIS